MLVTRLWVLMTVAMPTCLLLCGTIAAHAAEQKKPSGSIIKWVDEKGVTHYGDRMPAKDSGRNNSVINSQGIVLKRNQAADVNKKIHDQATLDQQRRDRALLATFTTEEEIDLARDRNTQLDKTTLQGLQQRLESAQARLLDTQKTADTYKKRNQVLPADLASELKGHQADIAKIESQIVQRRKIMETTNARFDEDKRRFRELKAGEATPRETSQQP